MQTTKKMAKFNLIIIYLCIINFLFPFKNFFYLLNREKKILNEKIMQYLNKIFLLKKNILFQFIKLDQLNPK